jgi:ribosome-associated translation inhibitor RaiA
MNVPVQVSFRGLRKYSDIESLVYEQAGKLEKFCDHVSSCRVAIEKTQHAQRRGNPYRVRIDVTVAPRHELIVRREPSHGDMHFPLGAVVRNAFRAMQRQLIKLTQRQRGWIKTHHEERDLTDSSEV